MTSSATHDRGLRALLWVGGLLAVIVLNVVSLLRGDLNQDEGWYLYGARLAAEGQRPYVDFATTQGPVMTYAYALATPIVRHWGLAGGRLFTSVLGGLAVLGAAWLAARLARGDAGNRSAKHAALVAFFLTGVNVFQSYFTTIVKTYALASLWLVLAFLLLSAVRGRAGKLAPFAAGVCMALAAGTRITAVIAAGVTMLALLAARDIERRAAWARAGWFVGGGALAAGVIFLPFLLAAPEAFWFCLVQYHAGREVAGWVPWLAYKAGFIARVCQAYGVAVGVGVTLVCLRWWGAKHTVVGVAALRPPARAITDWLGLALWGSVVGISLVHVSAPFPYDDYQAMIYPLFAVGLAVALVRRCAAFWAAAAVCAACLVAAGASPLAQSWFIGARDRIWWPLKEQAPLAVLQATAREIAALPGVTPGAEILTQDPYLAVEANLTLPRGMELGQFCYFPDWSAARAAANHVLNAEQFREVLRNSSAPVAAFSGYGFAIRSPEVQRLAEAEQRALWELVQTRYQAANEVTPFGQADTTLRIFVRKPNL